MHCDFDMTLGVVTHVPHWKGPDGEPLAYEPYVREMRIWGELFSRVVICAPEGEGPMQGNQAPYGMSNIIWQPVRYSLSYARSAKLKRLVQLPGLILAIRELIGKSDFVHLRSPGHPALFGHLLVRLMGKSSITKWAGLNGYVRGERLPSRVERRLLMLEAPRHPVLVYGPTDRAHMISFLPALMSESELEEARRLSVLRRWNGPWELVSVGRLMPAKDFDLAIKGLGELRRRRPDLDWRYTLIGDGVSAGELRELAASCSIADRVSFPGAFEFSHVQKVYGSSHVAIMPGMREGWPKVIAEAWAHGCVPVAARAGLVPWIMQDPGSGVVFDPTPEGLAAALAGLLDDRERVMRLSKSVLLQAGEISLECFKSRLHRVLVDQCHLVESLHEETVRADNRKEKSWSRSA